MDKKIVPFADKTTLIKVKPYTCKFQVPPKFYDRINNYCKTRGIKESSLFLISVDEFLFKNNF